MRLLGIVFAIVSLTYLSSKLLDPIFKNNTIVVAEQTPSITATRLMRIEIDCVKPDRYELDSKEYLMCIRTTVWSELNKQVAKDE